MKKEYNAFEINHERLWIIGMQGHIPVPLMKCYKRLGRSNFPLEIAPIKREEEFKKDFLAAYCMAPPIDLTLAETTKDVSILAYGLDREKCRELVTDIVDLLEMSPIPPTEGYRNDIKRDSYVPLFIPIIYARMWQELRM